MKIEILPKIQQSLWAKLAGAEEIAPFYLAGGTAAALHLEHRESVDFDFFRPEPFKPASLLKMLPRIGPLRIETETGDTLIAYVSDVKVSFFQYTYPLISDLHACEEISVADLKDIVAMKMIAIAQRGAKKDFLDLHAVLNAGWNFEAIFQCVELKFPGQTYNKLHLLKSLTWFADAESDPMPKMLKPVSWATVKKDLRTAVGKFTLNTN